MKALRPDGSRCFFFSVIGPGDDEEVVGDVGERDPRFLAVQDVAIALLDGGRLDARARRCRRRLGQPVAGDLPALRLRHEIPLLLILGAPRQQRQAVQAGVHRHDHAQRRVDVLELLAGQAEADVVHAGAAVLLRHRDAEQTERRHAAEHAIAIEAMLPVGFPDVRRDLARAPLADRLLEQTLFVGEIEVDHVAKSAASLSRAARGRAPGVRALTRERRRRRCRRSRRSPDDRSCRTARTSSPGAASA